MLGMLQDNYAAQLALAEGTDTYQVNMMPSMHLPPLFYLETMTKDTKLAHPIGPIDCSVETVPRIRACSAAPRWFRSWYLVEHERCSGAVRTHRCRNGRSAD